MTNKYLNALFSVLVLAITSCLEIRALKSPPLSGYLILNYNTNHDHIFIEENGLRALGSIDSISTPYGLSLNSSDPDELKSSNDSIYYTAYVVLLKSNLNYDNINQEYKTIYGEKKDWYRVKHYLNHRFKYLKDTIYLINDTETFDINKGSKFIVIRYSSIPLILRNKDIK